MAPAPTIATRAIFLSSSAGSPQGLPEPAKFGSHSVLDGDGLDLRVFVQSFVTLLPAVSALLESPEWELDTPARTVGVDEHLTGSDLSGEPVCFAHIASPHRCDQAVVRAVGYLGGLFEVIEGGRDQHGTEHLFPGQPVSGRDPAEQ